MESIWSKTVKIPEREPLRGVRKTEVAVIGAGMAGLLTAYYLKKQGKKVIVLEADRIGSGQTKNTTAKITSQHGCIYRQLIKNYGEEFARLYASANEDAINRYEALIREEQLKCHFERLPSYLYALKDAKPLRQEQKAAVKCGISASFTEQTDLPFPVKGAVRFENQAQFHPLEFLKGIAEKLEVYENTKVLRVNGHLVKTGGGEVEAKHIVFAAHYPFILAPGFYFARMHQERSYVTAVTGIPKFEGMYYCAEEEGFSFRWYEDVLLIGGGGSRTGKAENCGGYSELRNKVGLLYSEYEEVAAWSAQDCVSHDKLPFIGRFSCFRPYWYIASGLKKWGMTGAMVSAALLCDQICGVENPCQKLFTPQRFHLKTAWKSRMKDYKISTAGILKGYLHLPFFETRFPSAGQAKILRRGWKRFGVYRDEDGQLHRVLVKCRHIGCELAWNPQDKTWDCPCHGSRYDCDGKLIDGPAQTSVSKAADRLRSRVPVNSNPDGRH